MGFQIDRDHRRFKDIVRGRVKEDLQDHVNQGSMTGQEGEDPVEIPMPSIELPEFQYDNQDAGGVGMGDGEVGDVIGEGEQGPGQEPGEAGEGEGDHEGTLEMPREKLAQLMGEQMELPDIEPKGSDDQVEARTHHYNTIREEGPKGLMDFKRSYKEALKRAIASGEYDPDDPDPSLVMPRQDDRRYKARTVDHEPEFQAVVVYIMDVSGSMENEQRKWAQRQSFWLDLWLEHQYDGVTKEYITHDASAEVVDRETFFKVSASGGTQISSAYQACRRLLDDHYPASDWNTYIFQYSDGDNWSMDDTETCLNILEHHLLARANQLGYVQTESPYGSGKFYDTLDDHFGEGAPLVLTEIESDDDIYSSIRTLLQQTG